MSSGHRAAVEDSRELPYVWKHFLQMNALVRFPYRGKLSNSTCKAVAASRLELDFLCVVEFVTTSLHL